MRNMHFKFYIKGFIICLIVLNVIPAKASDSFLKQNSTKVFINNSESRIQSNKNKGLIKQFIRKIKEKSIKEFRKIKNKIRRIFSKKKSKKDRMRSNFKNRNRNLYNILIFSLIFFSAAGLIVLLSYYLYFTLGLMLGLYLFYILGLSLIISAVVISLIYLSGRYTRKPA